MDICVQVSVWVLCFQFSGHIPRSGIAGLGGEMGDLLHTVVTESLWISLKAQSIPSG